MFTETEKTSWLNSIPIDQLIDFQRALKSALKVKSELAFHELSLLVYAEILERYEENKENEAYIDNRYKSFDVATTEEDDRLAPDQVTYLLKEFTYGEHTVRITKHLLSSFTVAVLKDERLRVLLLSPLSIREAKKEAIEWIELYGTKEKK